MDLHLIIRELQEERNKIEGIVRSLEALQLTANQKREETVKRGRPSMDPEARREVSDRMKRYWEQRRKGSGA